MLRVQGNLLRLRQRRGAETLAQPGLERTQGLPGICGVSGVLSALQGRAHMHGALGFPPLPLHAQFRTGHRMDYAADEQDGHLEVHAGRVADRRRYSTPRNGSHRIDFGKPARRAQVHRHRRDQLPQGTQLHDRGRRPRARQGRVGPRGVRRGRAETLLRTAWSRTLQGHQAGVLRRGEMDQEMYREVLRVR